MVVVLLAVVVRVVRVDDGSGGGGSDGGGADGSGSGG